MIPSVMDCATRRNTTAKTPPKKAIKKIIGTARLTVDLRTRTACSMSRKVARQFPAVAPSAIRLAGRPPPRGPPERPCAAPPPRPHSIVAPGPAPTPALPPGRWERIAPRRTPRSRKIKLSKRRDGWPARSTRRPASPSSQDYRFGHPCTDSIGEPRLRCNVFALLSRSILLSSPVRLQIGSGQGVPATPAATLPTPLRPCLSATPRSGCPALAALPSGHRQRPDPAQHVTEQPPVQMSLGQQQPVVAGMFDQTAAGLH